MFKDICGTQFAVTPETQQIDYIGKNKFIKKVFDLVNTALYLMSAGAAMLTKKQFQTHRFMWPAGNAAAYITKGLQLGHLS